MGTKKHKKHKSENKDDDHEEDGECMTKDITFQI